MYVILQTKKKQLIEQMMADETSYWGATFTGVPQEDKDKWLLDLRDMLAWEFDKDGLVTNDSEFVPEDQVRLFSVLTAHKARGCHQIALDAWKDAKQHRKLRNWAHVKELKSFVNKLVYAVQVPTVNGPVMSSDFPSMYGLQDETPEDERDYEVRTRACVCVL